MERPISFDAGGKILRGILHLPGDSKPVGAIVFLNAGLDPRVGPGRFYVSAARQLTNLGFACLRYDFPGVGDSNGQHSERNLFLWSDTTSTHRAIDFLLAQTELKSVILLGSCAGARHSVWAARRDPRVMSLALISMPITYDATKNPLQTAMRRKQLKTKNQGRSALAQMLESNVFGRIILKIWRARRALASQIFRIPFKLYLRITLILRHKQIDRVFREGIFKSCITLLREGRKMLFIYGVDDTPVIKDFRQHFLDTNGTAKPADHGTFEYRFVEDVGHVFYGQKGQKTAISHIQAWLLVQQHATEESKTQVVG